MQRILVLLAVLAGLILLVGGSSAFLLRWAVAHQDSVISNHATDLLRVEDFILSSEHAARKTRSFLLTGNPRYLRERQLTRARSEQELARLREHVESPTGRALLGRIEVLWERLKHEQDALVERRAQGMSAEEAGRQLELEVQPDRDELDATLSALKRHKERLLEEAKQAAGDSVSRAFTFQSVTLGAGLLLAGALGLMLLRTWRRLLEASEFQQRVISIVGHDVRSPLAAILASVSHALGRQELPPPLAAVMRRVLRSARRIEVLTRLLVDFTRARTPDGLTLVHEPGDVHALCEHVLAEMRQLHPTRTLVHEREGDGRADFDAERLGQALANLVDNALRHGAAEGPVTLVSRGTNPSVVEVRIHNLGAPIDPALLPHIFKPFRHGQRPQEVVRESLGMGLYIVAEVVRAHGGRVEVESTAARGTTFTVRLPRMPVGPEEPARREA